MLCYLIAITISVIICWKKKFVNILVNLLPRAPRAFKMAQSGRTDRYFRTATKQSYGVIKILGDSFVTGNEALVIIASLNLGQG